MGGGRAISSFEALLAGAIAASGALLLGDDLGVLDVVDAVGEAGIEAVVE